MLTRLVTALLLLIAATSARAPAAAEYCPAQIQRVSPIGSAPGKPASSYVYELEAFSPRTIAATIVADTSGGWYQWSVSRVALQTVTHYTRYGSYNDAASAPLWVEFPAGVSVHHAWVRSAKSSGEQVMGWDAQGEYSCAVPPFSPDSITEVRGALTPGPAPAPLPSPSAATLVTALTTAAPFPITKCGVPFAPVDVVKAVQPRFPAGQVSAVTALVDVTVDPQGNVIDSTVHATSGSKDADVIAANVAAESTYKAGIAYCLPVGGHYLFRADFNPN